jgi:subtilisin-like proprotein convertase family protein
MNGTSAAAPTISGVAALLLSANNTLTTRDIKHILASTAVKNDSTAGATANAYAASPAGHVWEQGWITNAAGFNFHNYYGFGMVNTDAAVAMATTGYVALAAEVQTGYLASGAVAATIPANSAVGAQSIINTATNLTVETIQIIPNITHANIGRLGIEITSPAGKKSILMNVNNSLDGLIDLTTGNVFLSNAFYGENSSGNWTIKVIDGAAGTAGTLNNWQINITGH